MLSIVPPLPGEPLHSVAAVAERAACSRQAVNDAIRNGKLIAVRAAGRILITESEAERFIREWPARNKGVAARWREFREWQAQQRAATQQLLMVEPTTNRVVSAGDGHRRVRDGRASR